MFKGCQDPLGCVKAIERFYNFVRRVIGLDDEDTTAFVRSKANKVYSEHDCRCNVMVLNLKNQGKNVVQPADFEYTDVQHNRTHYGIWVFSGRGEWTNRGKLKDTKWYGIAGNGGMITDSMWMELRMRKEKS